MNNGETTNNNQNNAAQQPVLAPMAGVTIAPASDQPTNASHQTTAVGAVQASQPQVAQPQAVTPAQVVAPTPTIQATPQPATTVQQQTVTPLPQTTNPQGIQPTSTVENTQTQIPTKKKKGSLMPILFFIIIGLIIYIVYMTKSYQNQINQLDYNCTPITNSKKEIELDLNSTLVKDLYKKVATNIREDLAQPEFNDNMRLYLAYRQITEIDKVDSNCKGFSVTSMEPYTCEESTNFMPKAFSEEALKLEIKKLYGEKANIPMANIQLGTSCIVGYQYIPDRHEFVQGICNQQQATSYKVDKVLKKAISTKNTIILTEDVQYHANEKLSLPESLKNGTYYYTFRLDMNYNYVLVSKTYESKY